MSPIAQSVELPSLASTSTARAILEHYTVFLAIPLAVVVVALIACTLVACTLMRKRAGALDVERGPDEAAPRLVNLNAEHRVVVVHAKERCSMYAASAGPTYAAAAAGKTPTIVVVAPDARRSVAIELDITEATHAHVLNESDTSAPVQTCATLRQPAKEAWWITPKAVAVAESDIVDAVDAMPREYSFNEAWWTSSNA